MKHVGAQHLVFSKYRLISINFQTKTVATDRFDSANSASSCSPVTCGRPIPSRDHKSSSCFRGASDHDCPATCIIMSHDDLLLRTSSVACQTKESTLSYIGLSAHSVVKNASKKVVLSSCPQMHQQIRLRDIMISWTSSMFATPMVLVPTTSQHKALLIDLSLSLLFAGLHSTLEA